MSGFHSSTFSSSRPKPTVRREILVLIHLRCRRSFHCDGSPSLRLFALGLRANKGRLLGPCCLGGSPSRFIDQSRGVLLFVFFSSQRLSLISYFASYCNSNILIFFCFSLWRGSFFAVGVTWRVVFSLVFSFLGFSPRVLSALCASLVRPFEFTCGVLRICSVCCARAWFMFGVAGKQYAQSKPWEESLHSVTVSSALCLFRLAGCPLHSA